VDLKGEEARKGEEATSWKPVSVFIDL